MKTTQIESVLTELRRLMRATDLHSRELVRKTGLTTPQILLLRTIDRHENVSISELSAEVNLSQATVTSILDRLENRQLTVRKRSEKDKRKVHACLTDEGKARLNKAPPLLQEHFIRRFLELEDWERSMIISSLQRIASMMDAENVDAAPLLDTGTLDDQYPPEIDSNTP